MTTAVVLVLLSVCTATSLLNLRRTMAMRAELDAVVIKLDVVIRYLAQVRMVRIKRASASKSLVDD